MKRVFVQQFFLKKKKDKAIIRNKVKKEQAIMKLSSYLNTKSIFLDLQEESIDEVIKEMVKRISKSEENIKGKEKEIGEAVVKREKEVSTAIGSGIAIPHARIDNFNDFIISIALLKKPLTMNIAGTNKEDKVDFVVLIISDVLKNKNILKTMSAISKMALKNSELLEKIKKSSSSNEVIKRFEEANIEIEHRIIADDVLSPDIVPLGEDATLEDVAKRLILEKVSGLPVVDKSNNFLGEITERELIEFGMPKYTSLLEDLNFLTVGEPFEEYLLKEKTTTIKELFRKNRTVQIDRNTPIMEICSIIVKKGVNRLYVVENNKYVGMIQRSDIIKKVLHI